MLTKSELVAEISDDTQVSKADVRKVLDDLAVLAADEVAAGEDFTIPGVGKIVWRYTKPKKKGQKYPGFGGEEKVAEKNTPAKLWLAATAHGSLKKIGKATTLSSKAGKNVAARKG
jgi:nucleoid DNA-binding protein